MFLKVNIKPEVRIDIKYFQEPFYGLVLPACNYKRMCDLHIEAPWHL
jgi:hypothetical protein